MRRSLKQAERTVKGSWVFSKLLRHVRVFLLVRQAEYSR
jgi:hypothetical protein